MREIYASNEQVTLEIRVPDSLEDFPVRVWKHADVLLLERDGHPERVLKVFSNTKFKFNLLAVVKDQGVGKKDHEAFVANPDAVNMIFNTGYVGPYHPFTPWIMAHRVMHGIQTSRPDLPGRHPKPIVMVVEGYWEMHQYLVNAVGHSLKPFGKDFISFMEGDETMGSSVIDTAMVLQALGTHRTSRIMHSRGATSLDIPAEFFANYLINGGVQLVDKAGLHQVINRIKTDPDVMKYRKKKEVDSALLVLEKLAAMDDSVFSQHITALQEIFNKTFEKTLEQLVGEVISF